MSSGQAKNVSWGWAIMNGSSRSATLALGDARKVNPKEEAQLVAQIAAGAITKHYPVKQAVLEKIIAAAKQSKALPTGLLTYL
jgi:hypothetical protein